VPDPAAQATELRRGKLKEALTLRQSGKHKDALGIYDELLRTSPADMELAVEKGRTLVTLERWKDALDTLKPVLANKSAPAGIKALALEAQGEVLARNNQHDAAILSNTAALQINPKLLGALFWRGYSSYTVGAFDTALTDFQQAGAIVPKSPLYPGWEALAFISTGDLVKAREAIDRGLAIQADNTFALTARARLRLVLGELNESEADLASLVRRGPLGSSALQTQQLIMIHRIFKPSDPGPVETKP